MAKKPAKNRARMNRDGDAHVLRLHGVVGDEFDGFTDEDVHMLLDEMPDESSLRVHINSVGGVVHQGVSVYQRLSRLQPEVHVDGLAASIASVIAMAGGRVVMHTGSMMMIHDPMAMAMGDSEDMRKAAQMLDKVRDSIVSIYMQKTGHDRDTLEQMMNEETWLTAEEAVEWGFADELVGEGPDEAEESIARLDLSWLQTIPDGVAHAVARRRIAANSGINERTAMPSAETTPKMEDHEMSEKNAQTDSADESAAENTETRNKETNVAENDVKSAAKAEADRRDTIRSLCARSKLPEAFAQQLIDEEVDLVDVHKRVESQLATIEAYNKAREAEPETRPEHRVDVTRDEADTRREGVAGALLNRFDPGRYRIEDSSPAQVYRGMSLMEIARECVDAAGMSTRGMDRQRIAQNALHSTSDFPAILENVVGKSLRDAYEASPRTFTALGRRTTLPDYKEVSRVQMGEAPKLEKVVEGAEYQQGTIGDAAERYRLFKYGKIVAITREVIINDDLDAFTRIPMLFGRSAANLESDLFWEQVTSNPTMQDGNALFSSAHGNLAGTGGAISIDAISEGRTAMRTQKGLDGEQHITVRPMALVVPAALETEAEQFISTNLQADAAGNINPFAGRLQAIAEPRLDDASTSAWYLWADPAAIDTIEFAYLQGEEGPFVESREGFEVDGMQVKARLDFGVKAIDWRGLYKNEG